jgi:hypothetical protein
VDLNCVSVDSGGRNIQETHKEVLRDFLTQEKCELLLHEVKELAQWILDQF